MDTTPNIETGQSHGSYWTNNYYRARNYLTTMSSSPHEFTNSDIILMGQRFKQPRADDFYKAWLELVWCTYRCSFPAIKPSSYTTDAGWGCMLRSAQMVLAHVLMLHFQKTNEKGYLEVLSMFMDVADPTCIFSIHNLLRHREIFGKRIGDWFGPNEVCVMLRESMKNCTESNALCIVVAENGSLYKDKIIRSCTVEEKKIRPRLQKAKTRSDGSRKRLDKIMSEQDTTNMYENLFGDWTSTSSIVQQRGKQSVSRVAEDVPTQSQWKSAMIMIPVMLGTGKINIKYVPRLLECFQLPYNSGIIGGKPRASLFFVGYQDEKLLYLDPHTVQETVTSVFPPKSFSADDAASYHCKSINSIEASLIDPSLAVCFYCRTRDEFEKFWKAAVNYSKQEYSVFYVADKEPQYDENLEMDVVEQSIERKRDRTESGFVIV